MQPFHDRESVESATFHRKLYDAISLFHYGTPLSKAPSTPATMSNQHCGMLQFERFFRQSRMQLRQCCRFRQQCRTKFRLFDVVETN